uniref:plasmid replication protein, CyRepA1 family n=1 Tax=Picosynechococcus sp. PCC 7117 TaxID=195498 RepID=UPI0008107468|nr:plasmid replication protein, CyRepA1 family [Picosynechococcus sp. PCC 7117]ANV88854.1 hypothetical protein AWQ22_14690 [Picosynechococcus sp. PCC 7117]
MTDILSALEVTSQYLQGISLDHYQEWVTGSGIAPEITRLNVRSLSGMTPYEYLLYSDEPALRRNDGRLRDNWLKRYAFVEHGGWWCSGIDIKTGKDSLWGCFKGDRPRKDRNDKKPIKYEHPHRVPTEIFALKVDRGTWGKIAKRHKVELPETDQGFWKWVLAHPELPILITEGAKKAGALLTAGYCAIGLPGIYNGIRTPKNQHGEPMRQLRHLIPELDLLAKNNRAIAFCFDQDKKPKTIHNVNRAIQTTGALLEKAGAKVSVIRWEQDAKGVDDLIVEYGAKALHNAYKRRKPLDVWEMDNLTDITHQVDLTVNQRYLDIDPQAIPKDAQIIFIKSAKGTGKTEYLGKIIKTAQDDGARTLVLTHRIQLAKELARRFDIDHISELDSSPTGGALGMAMCVDSLHLDSQAHFNFLEWHGAHIVLDEIEQVLGHALNSSTCTQDRAKILETLYNLILYALGTGGKLYCSDADLSPISYELIKYILAGCEFKPFTILNTYKPCLEQERDLFFYDGNDPRALLTNLHKAIENGDKPLVFTAAQKTASTYSTQNLESLFRERYPDKRILRIDAESVAEPGHPAYGCIDSLNAILPLYDIVICSPAVETGVSIDIKGHFDSVWGMGSGVQTVNGFCQGLERLRDNVPRHVWVPRFSPHSNRIANGGYTAKAIARDQHRYAELTHKLIGEHAAECSGLEDSLKPFLWAYCRYAAIANRGFGSYREAILNKLLSEGYVQKDLSEIDPALAKDYRDELKAVKDHNYLQERVAISKVENPDDRQYEKLKRQRAKTETERHQERHGKLSRSYGLTVTPELVEKDDDGWYSQLQLEYYLTVGKAFCSARDRAKYDQLQHEGFVFKPDINRRSLSPKIHLLEVLNIHQFLQPGVTFTSASLEGFKENCLRYAKPIKWILGRTITDKMSPLEIAQALLGKLDRKLEYKGRFGSRDNRQRVYEAIAPNDQREKVFAHWLQRDQAKLGAVSNPCINRFIQEA